MSGPIELSTQAMTQHPASRSHVWLWRQRGILHATLAVEVGFRVAENGALVPDSTARCGAEDLSLRVPQAEVVVVGANVGWLRLWRGQEKKIDKSGKAGLGPLPPIAPQRIAKLQGQAAPSGALPVLHDHFDFNFFHATDVDQWVDALMPGDIALVYGPDVQQHSLMITVPTDAVQIVGGPPITMRCDRLFIDADRRQCAFTWRGDLAVRDDVTLKLAAHYGAPGSAVGASENFEATSAFGIDVMAMTGGPAPPAPVSSSGGAENVGATMGVDVAMGPPASSRPGGALPFHGIKRPKRPKPAAAAGGFAAMRQQQNVPQVDPMSIDSTMGIAGAIDPPPPMSAAMPPSSAAVPPASVPLPPAAVGAPPSAPGAPPSKPEYLGDGSALPDELEEAAAPELAEEAAIQMTAMPVMDNLPTPEPAAPSAPQAPASAPQAAAPKKQKKNVRSALLKKMRKK